MRCLTLPRAPRSRGTPTPVVGRVWPTPCVVSGSPCAWPGVISSWTPDPRGPSERICWSKLSGSRRRACDRTQAVQSFALDLAASLLAHAEPLTDLLMGFGVITTEAVATHDDLSVTFREQAQHRVNLVPALARDRTLERVPRPRVGQPVAQQRRVLAHRLVQRSCHPGRLAQGANGRDAQ